MIVRLLTALVMVMSLTTPALAQLAKGDRAPDFTTRVALAGEATSFSLSEALTNGPVVVYFYPKAFTHGCTLEANAFAVAMPDFEAAGASVIGMSGDDIETLKRFSREECRDAFPVGVASPSLISSYGVSQNGTQMARRTSYVISQDGRIHYVYDSSDYRAHTRQTLASVRGLTGRARK
ncbi:MAG: peroxiredoxin [Pseudomonadota bacterium]